MKDFGRPNIYTPEELKEKADEFFDLCEKTIIDKGIAGKIKRPKTFSGINLYLGVSKNYFSEKKKDKDYLGTIEYIRNTIENDVEEKALIGVYSPGASSFNLKNNFDWKEKSEVKTDVTMKDYIFNSNLDDK